MLTRIFEEAERVERETKVLQGLTRTEIMNVNMERVAALDDRICVKEGTRCRNCGQQVYPTYKFAFHAGTREVFDERCLPNCLSQQHKGTASIA